MGHKDEANEDPRPSKELEIATIVVEMIKNVMRIQEERRNRGEEGATASWSLACVVITRACGMTAKMSRRNIIIRLFRKRRTPPDIISSQSNRRKWRNYNGATKRLRLNASAHFSLLLWPLQVLLYWWLINCGIS